MNKEFVPYEEALALKELGFDEPCFGYYLCKNSAFGVELELTTNWIDLLPYDSSSCKAPLYQQAFRWFREKYDLVHRINRDGGYWICAILDLYDEEAELECLRKLIQIAKGKTA
jgi:hypothetical protein